MWNDIPSDELKQLMDEIDATELHPDLPNWSAGWRTNSPKRDDESGSNLPLSFFCSERANHIRPDRQPPAFARKQW